MTKKPLRIAYIGQKGIPALWGGVERATEELAVRMAEAGYFVTAYCRKWYVRHRPAFYRNVRLKYTPTFHTKHLDTVSHTFFSVINAIWNGADVIHFQGIGPAIFAWIPRIFSPHTRVLVTFHCLDRDLQKWNWVASFVFYCGEFIAAKCAHEIFATSRSLEQYVQKTWNIAATYLPNGVYEHAETTDFQDQLDAFGLKPQRYIVCLGRLMRDKAQHEVIATFVRAKERLGADFSDLKLVIIGDVADPGDSYRAFLEEQVGGNTDIVFAGVQTGAALKALTAYARAGISLSYSEGMPLAVLELATAGIPLVLSDISAHREILGEAHVFIEVGNIERASEHLARTVRNYDDILGVTRALAKRIASNYQWDIIVARYCVSLVAAQSESEQERVVLSVRPAFAEAQ